jgi:enterochelin esterase-like enzyme
MPLTSGILLWIMGAAYVASIIFLLNKWSAFKNVATRFISVFVSQLLLITVIGLFLNNSFGFYNSWSELFGVTDQNSKPITASAIDLSKATYTANGSAIIEEHFTGDVSKVTASIWLLIPKNIVASIKAGGNTHYPVAMFMSGSPGVPTAWLNGLKLDNQIQTVKNEVKLGDFISVLPDYNIQPHVDTGCMNIPGGVQVEDWIAKDVASYVIKNLPAKESGWMITGYSTGGWCSAMLALKHPELFKSAAPIAGYFAADFPFAINYANKEVLKKKYDLLMLAKTRPVPADFFLITSKGDSSSYHSTNWFYSKVGSGHNIELLTLSSGGHNFTTWRPVIQDILKWYANEI